MPKPSQAASLDAASHSRYRVGALLYFFDAQDQLLLLRRSRPPNRGKWCAVGGKLEMTTGESPYQCAAREAREEVGMELGDIDLDLRCILSEKDYLGTGHWLMFIFLVKPRLAALPPPSGEGEFRLCSRDALDSLDMPPLDRRILQERIFPENARPLSFLSYDSETNSLELEGWVGESP